MSFFVNLVASVIPDYGHDPSNNFKTDFSVNRMAYWMTGWFSVVFGTFLLTEQYLMQRITCFLPTVSWEHHEAATQYCWYHGSYASNQTSTGLIVTIPHAWLQQAYVFYFVRAFTLLLPHLVWALKYNAQVMALLKGTGGSLKDLEEQWAKYMETAEKTYRIHAAGEADDHRPHHTHGGVSPPQPNIRKKLKDFYDSMMTLTRDMVYMLELRVSLYHGMLYFTELRLVYDVLAHGAFLCLDLTLFWTVNAYQPTDFFCRVPEMVEGTLTQCTVPMMQVLWQITILSTLCNAFVGALLLLHNVWLVCYLFFPSVKGCILDQVPYASELVPLSLMSCTDRKTYKLLSLLLLQNYVVLHPLYILKSFTNSLKVKKLLGDDYFNSIEMEDIESTPMIKMVSVSAARERQLHPQMSVGSAAAAAGPRYSVIRQPSVTQAYEPVPPSANFHNANANYQQGSLDENMVWKTQ